LELVKPRPPNAAPDWLLEAKRQRPRATLAKVLAEHLPERLAMRLSEQLGFPHHQTPSGSGKVLGDTPDKALRSAEAALRDWRFLPNGSEGFAKAEVTAGGISTAELSSQTFEAKKLPGLYAIGEAVDVTGWLGGYNFQWAWASGHAAGTAI
jgi:predicted flavoprotein YhiN